MRGFPLQDEGPGMNELFFDLQNEQEERKAAARDDKERKAMADLKRNEVLAFDDGVLTVKMLGYGRSDGWATLAFNEKQFELNDEGYQVVEIPPSELYELRDFLNRILTERPGDKAI